MSFDNARRRHRRLLLACLVSALSVLFMRLGYWQLDRADQSRAYADMVQGRAGLPMLTLNGSRRTLDTLKYRWVRIEGAFEPAGRILLDGKKQDGRLGYHLIVPFHLKDSDMRVMVNRGWIPNPESKGPAMGRSVKGLVVAPTLPPLRLGAGPFSGNRPQPYLDLQRYADESDHPVQPFLVIENRRLAQQALTAGLEKADKWGMHIGYAIQWFVFALLTAIGFFIMMRKGAGGTDARSR